MEWVELVHWDPTREAETRPRRIAGPMLALSIEGNVSMRMGEPNVVLRGAFSRELDSGNDVFGGQIVGGSALALELVLEGYEDARLERDEDPPTGLSLWKGERTPGVVARGSVAPSSSSSSSSSSPSSSSPSRAPALARPLAPAPTPAPAPAPPAAPVSAWAQVAAVSADVERVQPLKSVRIEEDEVFLEPKKGDWVEHRQFGLCRVDGEDAEGALVIRLPNAQRKHIRLDVMDVLPPRQDGDRRIFPLRPRVKR